jgi:hypothetical protein
VVAPLEMKEGTTLGARAQSAIYRAAVLYKPRLTTFNFIEGTISEKMGLCTVQSVFWWLQNWEPENLTHKIPKL